MSPSIHGGKLIVPSCAGLVAGRTLYKACTDRAFVQCDPSVFHYYTSTNTSLVKYVIILRKYQKWSSSQYLVSIPASTISVLLILGHGWVFVSMFYWCTCFVLSLAPTPSCITLWSDSILLLLLPHFGSKAFIGFSLPLALRLNTLSVSQCPSEIDYTHLAKQFLSPELCSPLLSILLTPSSLNSPDRISFTQLFFLLWAAHSAQAFICDWIMLNWWL